MEATNLIAVLKNNLIKIFENISHGCYVSSNDDLISDVTK